jgi:hypothetical protein
MVRSAQYSERLYSWYCLGSDPPPFQRQHPPSTPTCPVNPHPQISSPPTCSASSRSPSAISISSVAVTGVNWGRSFCWTRRRWRSLKLAASSSKREPVWWGGWLVGWMRLELGTRLSQHYNQQIHQKPPRDANESTPLSSPSTHPSAPGSSPGSGCRRCCSSNARKSPAPGCQTVSAAAPRRNA